MVEIPLPPVLALARTTNTDEIASVLLDHAAQLARRVVLFVLHGGTLLVVDSRGTTAGLYEVGRITLPLSPSSTFSSVMLSATAFRGRLGDTPVESAWLERLGGVASDVLLLPILARGRTIGVLYADGWAGTPAEGALHAVVLAAGNAYERIFVERKQKQVAAARLVPTPAAPVPRMHPRYAVALACRVEHAGNSYAGRSFDLSRGGMCVRLAAALPIGRLIEVEVEFAMPVDDGEASKALPLEATAVWCAPAQDAHHFVGLRFVDMERDTDRAIDRYLRHLDPMPDFRPVELPLPGVSSPTPGGYRPADYTLSASAARTNASTDPKS